MKKFKIKTNLVSGIIMGAIALILIIMMPSQVRVPAYDSGAPSPRIIPGICLAIMLVSSIALIIQSLVLKQEKVVEFDWEKEKPAILLIVGMCVYIGLMLCIGYVLASLIVFRWSCSMSASASPAPTSWFWFRPLPSSCCSRTSLTFRCPLWACWEGSSDVGFCIDFAGYPAGVHPV